MFDTVFAAHLDYLRAHPEDRHGLKFLPVPNAPAYGVVAAWAEDVGQRWMRWVYEDPHWSTASKRRRFAQELDALAHPSAAQRRFWDGLRHAVAQFDHGEDR